jgi:hypothetical protein
MRLTVFTGALVGILSLLPATARAEEIPAEYRPAVQKALEYVAKSQNKDGHWEAFGGQYPVSMTGVAGMALLMEGSTMREGKYKDNIKRATDWLMSKQQPNGLIGDPNSGEAGRYMYGHGFALLFLSCVYGEEEEGDRRKRLEEILTKAAKFSHEAQTAKGGWGYVSAKDGGGFDEGSVTITQVQALRAARNAGIPVPGDAIKMAQKYLQDSTNSEGGVIYSLARGGTGGPARPALTAAAISCGFSSGDYKSELVKKWFKYCKDHLGALGEQRVGHDEYTHYYYAQAVYIIGDKGWKEMFPNDTPEQCVTWSKYRKTTFDNLTKTQAADGSWNGSYGGAIFATATALTIMQLDSAVLPIYQR